MIGIDFNSESAGFALGKKEAYSVAKTQKINLKKFFMNFLCVTFAVFVLTEAWSKIAVESNSPDTVLHEVAISGDDASNLPCKPHSLSVNMRERVSEIAGQLVNQRAEQIVMASEMVPSF